MPTTPEPTSDADYVRQIAKHYEGYVRSPEGDAHAARLHAIADSLAGFGTPEREALADLADYHEKQASHFEPFGPTNALTAFHRKASDNLRAALALTAPQAPAQAEQAVEQLNHDSFGAELLNNYFLLRVACLKLESALASDDLTEQQLKRIDKSVTVMKAGFKGFKKVLRGMGFTELSGWRSNSEQPTAALPRMPMALGLKKLPAFPSAPSTEGAAGSAPPSPAQSPEQSALQDSPMGTREALENILAYVRGKDDLYANGAIRQFAEEGLAGLAAEVEVVRAFWQQHTQSNVDRMSLEDLHADADAQRGKP